MILAPSRLKLSCCQSKRSSLLLVHKLTRLIFYFKLPPFFVSVIEVALLMSCICLHFLT